MNADEFIKNHPEEVATLTRWILWDVGSFKVVYEAKPKNRLFGSMMLPVCSHPQDALEGRFSLVLRSACIPFSSYAENQIIAYNDRRESRRKKDEQEKAWILAQRWDKLPPLPANLLPGMSDLFREPD